MKTIDEVLAEIDRNILIMKQRADAFKNGISHKAFIDIKATIVVYESMKDFILADSPKTECEHSWIEKVIHGLVDAKCRICGAIRNHIGEIKYCEHVFTDCFDPSPDVTLEKGATCIKCGVKN